MEDRIIEGKFYKIPESRWLNDGIYIFSEMDDIEILSIDCGIMDMKQKDDVDKFIAKNPDWVVGSAYETYHTIFLSKKPDAFDGLIFGSGFNYGSTNLLTGFSSAPDNILILAQND